MLPRCSLSEASSRASLPLNPVVANTRKCRNNTSRLQRKTSSQRGYEFRAKRAKYEAELVFAVAKLRNELAQLSFLHTMWQQKAVLLRNSDFGSLVQLVRELFRVFAKGLECESQDPTATAYSVVQFKENFLRHVVDPDVEIGEDIGGVDTLIEQWRRYTAAYADFHVKIEPAVEVYGPPEDPVLEVLVKMSGRFTHDTFRIMFPYAVHRQDLMQYFVGNAFVFDNMHHFRFTSDGRIKIYTLQVNFVEALVRTSGSLEAAAELLELSVISPYCTIGDTREILSYADVEREIETLFADEVFDSIDDSQTSGCNRRLPSWITNLDMPFLLGGESSQSDDGDQDAQHENPSPLSIQTLHPAFYDDSEQIVNMLD